RLIRQTSHSLRAQHRHPLGTAFFGLLCHLPTQPSTILLAALRAANKIVSSHGPVDPFDGAWDKTRTSRSAQRCGKGSGRCCRESSARARREGLGWTTSRRSTASSSCCARAFLGKTCRKNSALVAA